MCDLVIHRKQPFEKHKPDTGPHEEGRPGDEPGLRGGSRTGIVEIPCRNAGSAWNRLQKSRLYRQAPAKTASHTPQLCHFIGQQLGDRQTLRLILALAKQLSIPFDILLAYKPFKV